MTDQPATSSGFSTDGHLTDESFAVLADPRLAEVESTPGAQSRRTAQPDLLEHLALCAPCRRAFEATERALQALKDPAALLEPPAELWDRIAADLAMTPDQDQHQDQHQGPDRSQTPEGRHTAAHPTTASVTELRPRQSRRQSRRSRLWIPIAAAAAGAVLGGAAVAALLGQENAPELEPPVAGPTVVGGATLEPVAAEDFTGRAEMIETDEGTLELTVEISAAPDPEAGYFEVWLRDEEGTQLISLGAATADSTTLTVPAGIDLSQYPVVDVSHEHFDGDPGHSGTTLGAGPMEGADS